MRSTITGVSISLVVFVPVVVAEFILLFSEMVALLAVVRSVFVVNTLDLVVAAEGVFRTVVYVFVRSFDIVAEVNIGVVAERVEPAVVVDKFHVICSEVAAFFAVVESKKLSVFDVVGEIKFDAAVVFLMSAFVVVTRSVVIVVESNNEMDFFTVEPVVVMTKLDVIFPGIVAVLPVVKLIKSLVSVVVDGIDSAADVGNASCFFSVCAMVKSDVMFAGIVADSAVVK